VVRVTAVRRSGAKSRLIRNPRERASALLPVTHRPIMRAPLDRLLLLAALRGSTLSRPADQPENEMTEP
jgi:hypothetical protein